jgi:hypothetical protein
MQQLTDPLAHLAFFTMAGKRTVGMDRIPLETSGDESPVQFRDCFSVRYIQSAALLCHLAFAIEQEYRQAQAISEDLQLRHEVFVLNSVLSSVSFLESTINELYADAADEAYYFSDEKHEALLKQISEKWKNEKNFDRAPLLNKYQKILTLAGMPSFDEGDQAFANLKILIDIRNHLMHYTREWVVLGDKGTRDAGEETTSGKFERILRQKFATNPLAHRNQPFFPNKCLGHGCAEWAVINSLIFTDEFFRRLELPAPYEGIRGELRTR